MVQMNDWRETLERVHYKYDIYKRLIVNRQDDWGFIESDECDSLLFSGLVGCCEDVPVEIDAAYDAKANEWHRRPLQHGCCYNPDRPENQEGYFSKLWRILSYKLLCPTVPMADTVKENWYRGSTISRDMLIGLAWYAWFNKRLDISENVIKRALSHYGVMGRGDPARINIMPPLLATFAWISYKLGGPSRPWLRAIPAQTGGKLVDFQAHLQVLHILLRQEVTGKISKKARKTLRYHAKRQRNNALFQYADGNLEKAVRLMTDPVLWPENRLPTSRDRKEPWIFQRDAGSDWLPSDGEPHTHSGGDFIFLYSLITGQMR